MGEACLMITKTKLLIADDNKEFCSILTEYFTQQKILLKNDQMW